MGSPRITAVLCKWLPHRRYMDVADGQKHECYAFIFGVVFEVLPDILWDGEDIQLQLDGILCDK